MILPAGTQQVCTGKYVNIIAVNFILQGGKICKHSCLGSTDLGDIPWRELFC